MKRVTGIGGVFMLSKDPVAMKNWYQKHLGFDIDPYGARFEWMPNGETQPHPYTLWCPFADTTKYFEPSKSNYMINFRVADLEALVPVLIAEGVSVLDAIETYDYGKFVHILDLEGNKLELWEPLGSF